MNCVNNGNIVKLYKVDFWGRFAIREDSSWDERFVSKNKIKIEETLSWMNDEKSRKSLIDFMNQKQTCCFGKEYDKGPQYFDEQIVRYGNNEVFVDCGAYHGESSLDFISSMKRQGVLSYKRIIAFEPDEKNVEILKPQLKLCKNIEIRATGVGEKTEQLSFSSGDETSSKFSSDGDIKVSVESIDDVLSGSEATFIKMDIEGFELNALRGAAKTIKRYRPKLAICVYHKAEDLITIPQYIKELNSDYKLYFRNYKPTGTEAVLYAI